MQKSPKTGKSPVKRAAKPRKTVPAAAPTHDAIATRAYELFQRRGGSHGQDQDDWLAAERELQS